MAAVDYIATVEKAKEECTSTDVRESGPWKSNFRGTYRTGGRGVAIRKTCQIQGTQDEDRYSMLVWHLVILGRPRLVSTKGMTDTSICRRQGGTKIRSIHVPGVAV